MMMARYPRLSFRYYGPFLSANYNAIKAGFLLLFRAIILAISSFQLTAPAILSHRLFVGHDVVLAVGIVESLDQPHCRFRVDLSAYTLSKSSRHFLDGVGDRSHNRSDL